jgi:plastocyanin
VRVTTVAGALRRPFAREGVLVSPCFLGALLTASFAKVHWGIAGTVGLRRAHCRAADSPRTPVASPAMRGTWVPVVALLAGCLGSSSAPATKPVVVRVTAHEWGFELSRTQVPVGPVRFVLRNGGRHPHDFAIAGHKTRALGRGATAGFTVTFERQGLHSFRCTVRGHAELGMTGLLGVGRPVPRP